MVVQIRVRKAVRMTAPSLKMGRRNDYPKRQTSNTPLPVNASLSFDMPPGNRIFTTIDVNYGREALQRARRWEKTVLRQASTYAQLNFLHRCLANYVMPKCLSYKPPVNTELAKQTMFRHSRRMTRVLIQDCHLRLRKYAHNADNFRMLVTCRYGESTAITLENTLISLGRKKRANRDADLSVKFMALQTTQSREPEQTLVHNLSSKHRTVAQTKVLQRGSGFNTTDADPVTFITSFESVVRQTGATDEAKDLLRHQISSLLMSHRKTHSLLRDEQKALRELKADIEIVILPADKGRSTVILDKVDYRTKALMLLNDRESYMVSDAASLKSILAKVNRILSRLKKEKVITVKEWYMPKPSETPMARYYGLPKVHKPDVALRPIVSLRGTPTYGFANWLRFLTAGSETTVHSAEQFLDKIRAVTIEPNERMVSFDVVSLFTSIPQALAVETLSDLMRQNYDEVDGQPKAQDLIELMGHCLKTFFTFGGTTHEQIKGTPMGSPISGLIAEAVLQNLEKRLFGD
ncbi:hypothetical protein SprV_0902715000 [Sparganum proliferum]